MTPVMLMMAIKEFLKKELADEAATIPAVHLGALPSKTAENRDDPVFPLIIVRPMEGDSDDKESRAQVKLLFGTQSDDDSGFVDVLNLMERVRILLMRQRIIDKKFYIEPNWKWQFLEDQPEPQWICQAITTWTLPQIRQEVKHL
ncbi:MULTISPECIES: hypothetical protein [Paenibacillus]|jgi:hypothetical protein|uniref:hypothetical protein n=1 Tax=Paenibacillus TaxID=44249 RepID=UPI00096E2939|nr:hypothetical protein [Paenibacillus odorifer]OME03373.1 hypothetical protein BSK54_07940 [Paenibacillus odorifer]OME06406.1 hypothetical protein BSK60_32645 [Paenibacillus odorifer]